MGSIIDYARTETRGFSIHPFREADALVLAQLSYDDVPDCMPRLEGVESQYGTLRNRVKHFDFRHPFRSIRMLRQPPFDGISIARADDELHHDRAVPDHNVENVGLVDPQVTHDFYHAIAANPRFSDIEMGAFLEQFDGEEQTQFAAVTYRLPSGTLVVAFRGTDDSLVGWKEDFNLSYMPVIPSQKTATAYVSGVLSALPGDMPIYVGGHSKGGNLAEFAALTIDEGGYARIKRVFNHDGPSFLEAPSPRIDEPEFQAKLDKTVPESSVFGMILESRDDFRIVQSNAMGFFQHVPFTWIVDGCDFSTQRTLNNSAKMFDITLDRWLRSCSQHEREVFIDTMYDLITSSDAKSWADFQSSFMSNMATFMRDGRNLDDQTKEVMAHAIKNLGDVAGHTLRERLGATIERMKEAVPFIDTERDGEQSARKKN